MRDVLDCASPRLDLFLTCWYGPPDGDGPSAAGADDRLPCPLREWFEVVSRWTRSVATQNRVVGADEVWVEDGKQVFWVENQGVWLWGVDPVGVDPVGGDPRVWDRENEPGRPWQPTGVTLSAFLLHVAVFEAILNAQFGAAASWVTARQLEEILEPLTPIPGATWRWPNPMHQLYVGEDVLAFAGPNDGADDPLGTAEYREVWVAGRHPAAVRYLATVEDVEWDWSSWRD